MDTEKNAPNETDIEESNPNASGPQGLRGDLGVSSERTGPDDRTDGSLDTFATDDEDDGDVPTQEPATGPEMDDTQQQAAQGWRDGQPQAPTATGDTGDTGDTEENTAEVPAHDFDPGKNPGHSHG